MTPLPIFCEVCSEFVGPLGGIFAYLDHREQGLRMTVDFVDFFTSATGFRPYPYQIRLAESNSLPALLNAPTGSGKTEAIVLSWLWRRMESRDQSIPQNTPRRSVTWYTEMNPTPNAPVVGAPGRNRLLALATSCSPSKSLSKK